MLYSLWMRKTATPIALSEAEEETLRSWLRAGTSEQRMVERARIILAAAEGVGTSEIARERGTRAARGAKWRTRFATRAARVPSSRAISFVPTPSAAARMIRARSTIRCSLVPARNQDRSVSCSASDSTIGVAVLRIHRAVSYTHLT